MSLRVEFAATCYPSITLNGVGLPALPQGPRRACDERQEGGARVRTRRKKPPSNAKARGPARAARDSNREGSGVVKRLPRELEREGFGLHRARRADPAATYSPAP